MNGDPRRRGDARQVQGKELSYNNLNDTDAAFECVAEFAAPTVVIVKHANPCGVASAETLAEAWDLALRCDPVSAFGGIVAVNRDARRRDGGEDRQDLDRGDHRARRDRGRGEGGAGAEEEPAAAARRRACPIPPRPASTFRSLAGGFLVQTRDCGRIAAAELKVVTKRAPSRGRAAPTCSSRSASAKHVKSNAIVYAKGGATVGIGAGQMSRVDAARIAAWKAARRPARPA